MALVKDPMVVELLVATGNHGWLAIRIGEEMKKLSANQKYRQEHPLLGWGDDNGGFFVIPEKKLRIESLDEFTSFGSGREVAIGAMAMGANAIKAVEVTSRFIAACGNGCDWFSSED